MNLENKKIVVVGFKRTGAAVARFLARQNAKVTVTDMADEKALAPSIEMVKEWIANGTICLELGAHKKKTFENADLIVVSPGVPHTILPLKQAATKNVPIMGEIELAGRFIKEPIVAISGTNGKTTTTELLGHMLTCSEIKNFVGGNIGNPLIEYADSETNVDVVVAEISSFQLDTTHTFKPTVGILLNITDDHLDRYDGMAAYAVSKSRLFKSQTADDIAILNQKDLVSYPFLGDIKSRKYIFNLNKGEQAETVCSDARAGAVIDRHHVTVKFADTNHTFSLKGIHLVGVHNAENIAAASLGALAVGASVKGIETALETFKGLPHRLAYVETLKGIAFYNDSKATNVDAVKRAIETFSTPVILIMGGRDKGGQFYLLKQVMAEHVKALVVMGEAADIIGDHFKKDVAVIKATDMTNAVKTAVEQAVSGDTVLLSPGCASFDMFDNYAQRGRVFEEVVMQLKNKR